MKKKRKRSVCPIACTLDVLGDRWTMLIIRDLFCGKSHFKEFLSSPEKIATNILTERLQRLVDLGIVKKQPSQIIFGRDAYILTKKGKTLWPVLEAIGDWGLANIRGTKKYLQPTHECK